MPQLFESVNKIAARVVSAVSTLILKVNGLTASPSGWVVNVKEGMHSLTFRTQAVGGKATIPPNYDT